MAALIQNLDREKFTPFCITNAEGELTHRLRELGCECFIVPLMALKPRNYRQQFRNISAIRKIILDRKIDIIHPDYERDVFISGLSKKFTPAKMVWHARITRPDTLDRLNFAMSDGVIGVSDGVRTRFERFSGVETKYLTIFNGVDCTQFIPADKNQAKGSIGLNKDEFIILYAGQLKAGKGVYDLMQAAENLKSSGISNFKVILAGEGNSPREIEDMKNFAKVKAGELIVFAGQQENIHEWMQAADVLALPSHEGNEGMGRVLFEAMACGTPVVGSDISGIREAVSKETGFLVKEKFPNELAGALRNFYNNPVMRFQMGENAREHALKLFDIRIHARNVENFYLKLSGE